MTTHKTTRREFCKGYVPLVPSAWKQMLDSVNLYKAAFAGGRCSPKSLYIKTTGIAPNPRKEAKADKLRWLWFEEVSEFENYHRKGNEE